MKRRRTRDDWTAAALSALAEGGVGAVAVEPLAVKVGATKGSAYWHFPNREALLLAAVERWEREHTEAVIALVEAEREPMGRLRLLFGTVLERDEQVRIELALLAAKDDPIIAATLERVTGRRIDYLEEVFAALGFEGERARSRAVLSYSVYLGQMQLQATGLAVGVERRVLLEHTLLTLCT